MSDKSEIVLFHLRREADGLFTATSPDLAGVCVVHPDRDRIIADMPNIVRHWYKRHRGCDVVVFSGPQKQLDDTLSILTSAMPAEIAAQRLAG